MNEIPRRPSKGAYHDLLDDVREAAEQRGMTFRHAMMRACLWFLREVGEDVSHYGDGIPRISPPRVGRNSRRAEPEKLASGFEAIAPMVLAVEPGAPQVLKANGRSLAAVVNRLRKDGRGEWTVERAGKGRWAVARNG